MKKLFVLFPVYDECDNEVVDTVYPVSRIKSIVPIKNADPDGPKARLFFKDEDGCEKLFCDVYGAYERLNKED